MCICRDLRCVRTAWAQGRVQDTICIDQLSGFGRCWLVMSRDVVEYPILMAQSLGSLGAAFPMFWGISFKAGLAATSHRIATRLRAL